MYNEKYSTSVHKETIIMSYVCRIVDLQNQLHDANKRNEKLCQQLVETEEELRKKWISHINEKDKRFDTYIIHTYVYICTYV